MYIFIKDNKIIGCNRIKSEEKNIKNIEVSEDLFNDFCINPSKYIYKNNTIKIKEDYVDIIKQEKRKEEIRIKLKELDEKRIRAICEPSVKDETSGETWLDYYNSQAQILREELNNL